MENMSDLIRQLVGKRVIINTTYGSAYQGILYRRGEKRVVLSRFSWKSKDGAWSNSKHDTFREFSIDKIFSIMPFTE